MKVEYYWHGTIKNYRYDGDISPTSVASRTPSSSYKFSNIPKTLGVTLDEKFRRRKPL